METGRFVAWGDNREDFERVVESVIQRKWSVRTDGESYAVDGRGGDGGLDIYVTRDDKIVHVYQLKFFPEGMSAGFIKRRRQVKNSFDSMVKIESLETWTLVTPGNPTNAELRSTLALSHGRPVRIKVWGRADLDQEIAKFPDLLAAATRRPVVDMLRDAANETAALANREDLTERVRKLSELVDGRSSFWGIDFSVEGNQITQTLVAKRPDAHEREPIKVQFAPKFGQEHEPLFKEFSRMIEYGGSTSVVLPPEVVGKFSTLGPEWIANEGEGTLEIHPVPLPEPVGAELRVVSSRGAVLASLTGKIRLMSRGTKGTTIEAKFLTLKITFRAPNDIGAREGSRGEADLSYSLTGMPATSALSVLKFIALIEAGELWELYAEDHKLFGVKGPNHRVGGEDPIPQAVFELVDDLAVLEREYGVTFPFPTSITGADRRDIRIMRMLTEGKATSSPSLSSLTATLGSEADADEVKTLIDPQAVAVSIGDTVMEVLGRPLPVGTLRAYHPALKAADLEAHIAAINNGTAEGRVMLLEPSDGTPIRIWIDERWTDPNKPIIPEPWGLEGFPEHPGLALINSSDAPTTAGPPTAIEDQTSHG